MAIDRTLLFRLATSTTWERAVRATPVGERVAGRLAARYIAGAAEEAFAIARQLRARGVATSIDYFGELVADVRTAEAVATAYDDLAARLTGEGDGTWLAIDLSHLGLDIDPSGCADRLSRIARALPDGSRIQVGAEDFDRAQAVFDCVLAVAQRGYADRLGATVQANLHRSAADVERFVEAGIHVRLVKGAYVEPESRAFSYGRATDVAYLRLAHRLAEADAQFSLATHDGVIREALLMALGPCPVEQLLGVTPENLDDLVARDVPVRVYVPYGDRWFRYWMRRVAESRGA